LRENYAKIHPAQVQTMDLVLPNDQSAGWLRRCSTRLLCAAMSCGCVEARDKTESTETSRS